MNIRQVGNLFKRKRKNPNEGRVYDPRGLAPALSCMGGGNRMPFVMLSYETQVEDNRLLHQTQPQETQQGGGL